MSETKVLYLVQVLRQWSSLEVLGIPLDAQAAAPGCVGFLPVFDSIEAAITWKDENEHFNAAIIPIASDKSQPPKQS